MLEALSHEDSAFLTLTYADHATSLEKRHVALWLKRLRKRFGKVRFYAVGEYGEKSERPHYHVALFGVGPSEGHTQGHLRCPCDWCKEMKSLWKYGHVDTGTLTPESMAYICGYVTKKMTAKADPRLNGRQPEFATMSLKPGIGALALKDVAASLNTVPAQVIGLANFGDVPTVLQHGKRKLPLGRYLRGKLREEVEGLVPPEVARDARLRPVSGSNGCATEVEALKLYPEKQKILNAEAKYKIFAKKEKV